MTETIIAGLESGSSAQDNTGNPINFRENAAQVYNANSRRLGNTNKQLPPQALHITLGQLTPGAGETNTPTPQPSAADPTTLQDSFASGTGTQRHYRPYVAVNTPVLGVNIPFSFVAVANEPRLVSNNAFVPLSDGVVPSVVQVAVDEEVVPLAGENASGDRPTKVIHVIATAQAGGPRALNPTGGLYISFPQGFPPNAQNVDFTSVKTIMNSSQIDANATSQTPSPYTAWNRKSNGLYYQAQDGPHPGAGTLVEHAYRGRSMDDPSVSLAFMVYNWLKSLGTRPNVLAVKHALETPLKPFAAANSPGSQITISSNFSFLPPAYAGNTSSNIPAGGAVLDIPDPDPRGVKDSIGNFPDQVELAMLNVFDEVGIDAAASVNPTALRIAIGDSGNAGTTDGHPVGEALLCKNEIIRSNNLAYQTVLAAQAVLKDNASSYSNLAQQIRDVSAQLNQALDQLNKMNQTSTSSDQEKKDLEEQVELLRQQLAALGAQFAPVKTIVDRAMLAFFNGTHGMDVTANMFRNFGPLSGLGVAAGESPNTFVLAGSAFYAVTLAATKDGIIQGTAPSGQSPLAGTSGWLTAPDPANNNTGMYIYRHESQPVIVHDTQHPLFMQRALAETSIPPKQNFQFYFTVEGDACAGGGNINLLNPVTTLFAGLSLLQGQILYQNTKALIVPPGETTTVPVSWQVIARNQNAYSGHDDSGKETTYFADRNAPGNTASPAVANVVQWMVRCPVAECPEKKLVAIYGSNGFAGFTREGSEILDYGRNPEGEVRSVQDIVNEGRWFGSGWTWNRLSDEAYSAAQEESAAGCPVISIYHL